MFKMRLLSLMAFLSISLFTFAQVTTSSITGSVKDDKGASLEGATVSAIHQPSGTPYATSSKKGGGFNIPGARIGGPYKVTVSFAGFAPSEFDNIFLVLGEPYNINVTMSTTASDLVSVVVSGVKRKAATEKAGAATSVGLRQLQNLPTISRSITDFTRLTPQANGNSMGGRDGRYNNITVDGANLNNNFGLSTDALPGGGNPISLDAIEELSVNIAPYDVRQANFTGANIAAVTKSGTNTFHGSVYGLFRNQNYSGLKVSDVKLADPVKSKNVTYGATLGGPIIKNKLFFFGSYENEENTFPGITWSPTGGSGTGNISSTPIDSMRKLSNFLQSTYGYNTGAYDNFPNFASKNRKILGRVDWNIMRGQKLTVKYSDYDSRNDVQVNALSVSNLGSALTSVARFGSQAMSFANSNYAFHDVVKSLSFELNSTFNSKFANQFLATYTKVRTTRETESPLFPFVDILKSNNNNYMSFGRELFSNNNDVKNNTLNITNNFTYFAGKHTITAGASYEYQTVGNQFMPASQGYYVYNNLNDFITNAQPKAFSLTYSIVPGDDAPYSANLKIGQLGIYAQDEINVNSQLKLNVGLRVDRPVYPEQPLSNPAITALNLYDKDGNITHYDVGMWPKATNYWSPRAGFRWDVEGDKVLTIHGSSGVYTGRIPFVYLTNMPTNSGVYQRSEVATTAQLANIRFRPDAAFYKSLFPQGANTTPPSGGFVGIDPDFKFPQVWRTNLGFDRRFGQGWILGMDVLFTKDINSVYMFNANQTAPTSTVTLGSTTRPAFTSTATTVRRLNNGITNAIILTNSNKGAQFASTVQLTKNFAKGFGGSLAYTYTFATEITSNPGSTAASVWQANATSNTQNSIESSFSGFSVPHRIVGSLSYTKEYIKHLGTTISLFYEGAIQGAYSYIYNGDLNFDGNTSADLMYIPRNASEITFASQTVGTTVYTAQQQSDAFFKYVAQDKYLSSHMGQNAERNAARQPWYNRVDFKFLQDIFTNVGKNKHTIQLTLDCTNFLNLLNRDWGIRSFQVVNNPLRVASVTAGVPSFTLATYTPTGATAPILLDRTFINNNSLTSTWRLQVGARYRF
ncbi:MAG: carboxypeptidase regulatory-like domain-containing protein [Bacteroidota bacterium]